MIYMCDTCGCKGAESEDNIVRFKVGERYTHRYHHGYGFRDNEIMRRTDKTVWTSQVNPETGKVDFPLLISRHKIQTAQPFELDGEIISGYESYGLGNHGYGVKAGNTSLRTYDAESFESEMKGSVEYERGRTSTQYNLQEISQDYVVELDDEGIVLSEYNLQELEEAKEQIKERIKEEIEQNPQEYKDGGDIDDIYSNTEVEFKDGSKRDIGISEGRVESPKIITSFDNYDSKIEYEQPDDYYAETFSAESPFKSDAFNEGRSAGITFYTPESTKEDYYANLDTEYMIHYGLSPEDLLNDVENKSPRYLQFIAGFDDGWNYSTLLHEDVIVENKDGDDDMEEIDYEMAGEYFTDYPKGMREHISQTSKEFTLDGLMALGVIASIVGFGFFRKNLMNAEVRLAEESCSGDDDCPEGKVCVDGRCLPICEDDGDCASWQECRDDLHPTEKVCGEQSTDSFQELTTPKPKPQPEVQQDPPKAKESMFNPVSIAIGGGIVAVAVIGMNYLGKKKESE